jgi:hypothetical protein
MSTLFLRDPCSHGRAGDRTHGNVMLHEMQSMGVPAAKADTHIAVHGGVDLVRTDEGGSWHKYAPFQPITVIVKAPPCGRGSGSR